MQLLRSTTEVQFPRDGGEVAQVAKFHDDTFRVWRRTANDIGRGASRNEDSAMNQNPRIESIDAVLVDLPTIRAHKLAMTTMSHQTLVIVRLVTSDGICGVGEATTIGGLAYGDQSPESIKLTIDAYIAPLLQATDATNVNAAMQRVAASVQGNSFAKSAVETALLDAQGQRLGLPVHALLGGAFRTALPVLWTLASGDASRDVDEALSLIDARRHRVFKLKIGAASWRPTSLTFSRSAAVSATT